MKTSRLPRCLALLALLTASLTARALDPVQLHWLDKSPPAIPLGTSFGVPFPAGAVQKNTPFALSSPDGKSLPLQSFPLAYWPDGSIKWNGFATVPPANTAGNFTLTQAPAAAPASALKISQAPDAITLTNGNTTFRIPTAGNALIDSISIDNTVVASAGLLVAQTRTTTTLATQETPFESKISSVTLEQQGPVRAVIKIEGTHASKDRAWLPFTVRLYFFAGTDAVKLVHSFVFDGDQEKDFISALGIRFTVPLREPPYNRHVRFGGDEGLFQEPVQPVVGRRVGPSPAVEQHVQGQPLDLARTTTSAPPGGTAQPALPYIQQMAVWDSYKQTQLTPDGYEINKRTGAHSAYIRSTGGKRASGLAFLGDTTGGLALGLKNFWQLCPTAFEIQNASTSAGQLTAWLWSPEAQPMDMRHYDIKEHGLEAAYEDITPGLSTATGVARTHELFLLPTASVPPAADLAALAAAAEAPPLLVCSPEYLHAQKAFGVWSLPDRSTPAKKILEDQLDAALAFYQGQVEQRHWYGFWDFGDFMHSYDPSRHEWRYDIGGYAWANTELMPDMWLWLSFLRSGRPDLFRLAEAMTRQTQEVDVYHLGPMKGLGSRHNVRHWGDGAKELRVSQAALKRYYYYLTADDRTGDLMNEVIDVDQSLLKTDPLRKVEQDNTYPTHVRAGPDWYALVSNWLTAYERTGDKKYLDYVNSGIDSFAAMPKGLFSGGQFGYDPATKKIFMLHDTATTPHLAALMGGPEMWMEWTPILNNPKWTAMWTQYCRYLQSPPAEHTPVLGNALSGDRLGPTFAKMSAWAAKETKDPALAARAWSEFLGPTGTAANRFATKTVSGPGVPIPFTELPTTGTGSLTNDTAQWSINAIELLELVGNDLPPAK